MSDVAPSLSDDDDGDEQEEESFSARALRAGVTTGFVGFFSARETGGGAMIELVELCESRESLATRSRRKTVPIGSDEQTKLTLLAKSAESSVHHR